MSLVKFWPDKKLISVSLDKKIAFRKSSLLCIAENVSRWIKYLLLQSKSFKLTELLHSNRSKYRECKT